MPELLPPSASGFERALEASAARLGAVPIPVGDLWNPWRCPARVLPWLAWAVSVDEWNDDWPEATKRRVIAASGEVHRRKGTVWAVRTALRAAGLANAEIEERLTSHWAHFRVVGDLGESLTVEAAAAERVVRLIERYKPVSRYLAEIALRTALEDPVAAPADAAVYTPTRNTLYDGLDQHDGTRAYGAEVGTEVSL